MTTAFPINGVMEGVEGLVKLTQREHYMAFRDSGSQSYTELGRNLVAIARVTDRVRKALETLEAPHFTDYE